MRVKFPSHLYIRVDRDLRDALRGGADAAGENVSAFARRTLRTALTDRPDGDPPPAAPAARQPAQRVAA